MSSGDALWTLVLVQVAFLAWLAWVGWVRPRKAAIRERKLSWHCPQCDYSVEVRSEDLATLLLWVPKVASVHMREVHDGR